MIKHKIPRRLSCSCAQPSFREWIYCGSYSSQASTRGGSQDEMNTTVLTQTFWLTWLKKRRGWFISRVAQLPGFSWSYLCTICKWSRELNVPGATFYPISNNRSIRIILHLPPLLGRKSTQLPSLFPVHLACRLIPPALQSTLWGWQSYASNHHMWSCHLLLKNLCQPLLSPEGGVVLSVLLPRTSGARPIASASTTDVPKSEPTGAFHAASSLFVPETSHPPMSD